MPFNGSGTFQRNYSWTNDATNSIPISATRMDADSNDFATAFDNCLTRDGQGLTSVDFNFNSHKGVNLANGSLPQDAVTYAQTITALAASTGSAMVGYTQGGTGSVSRTVTSKLQESVSVKDFGAKGDGVTDDTAAIQAALNNSGAKRVLLPAGSYKITSTINVPSGMQVVGDGEGTQILAYGCNAFTIAAGVSGVTIRDLGCFSYTAGGVADPKLYDAVLCNGVSGNQVNRVVLENLYLQGWADCINWRYVWTSRLENVSTINCTYGLTIWGQTVNNSVSNCSLVANTGTASIQFLADGSITGEGLVVTNSLLSSGSYGITGVDHLGLCVTNCIIDLIGNVGINLTNPIKLSVSNSWIYAANKGVYFIPQGLPSQLGAGINNCQITVTAAGSKGVHIDVNNVGVNVSGGSITIPATGTYNVHGMSDSLAVTGVDLVNPSANSSVYFEYGTGVNCVGCTGNATIEFINGNPPKQGLPMPPYQTTITYSASMTPDCSKGSQFLISATNTAAYTINNPINTPYLKESGEITFLIANQSGGAAGAITWGSAFRVAGAWVQPSNGFFRTISFKWVTGLNYWAETSRITTDLSL